MITKQKIKIYTKYKGDIDGFSRGGKRNEKEIIKDNDWTIIDNVLQDLKLINNKMCSEKYKTKVYDYLSKEFDSESIEFLNEL